MGGKGRGYFGHSREHGLHRKGISTKIDEHRRFDVSHFVARGEPKYPTDHFATGKSLEAFLETPLGEEFIEEHFKSLYEIPYNSVSEKEGIPYWIDNYENMVTGERTYQRDFNHELMEHQVGYHDVYRLGQNRSINGKDYYYAGSQGSSEELELQADNGDLVYGSIGNNYFRIWKRVPETYISLEADSYELIHNNKTFAETEKISEMNNPKKALDDLKQRARKQGWELEPIMWDNEENKFIKGD